MSNIRGSHPKIENINKAFQTLQSLQLGLLAFQGIMILLTKEPGMYLPVWIGLFVLAFAQLVLVYAFPEKIKTNQVIDRSNMVRLRTVALLPYILILAALLLV
ncbi:hypothetical protein EYC58_02520 [Candidatus Saccharibacteria bacterium]|nr:MAG: hypothetical protein EYC58_02520 [Candidatus Saccharibacteria bacterium]